MSFSSKEIESPIKKYIEWKGSDGYFYYWDKELTNEDGEEVGGEVRLPKIFQVIPLDILKYVGGHNKTENKPIKSNEVKFLDTPFDVSTSNGVHIAKGTWKEIAFEAKSKGGKLGNTMYCMLMIKDQEPELVCVKVIGSSMEGLMKAKKGKKASFKIKGNHHILTLGKHDEVMKNGNNQYFIPTFEEKKFPQADKMTEAQKRLYDMAYEMDIELQAYLDEKLNKDVDSNNSPAPAVQQKHVSAPPMDLTSNAPLKVPVADNDCDELPF